MARRKSPLAVDLPPGTMLSTCSTCHAVEMVMSDHIIRWQQSIAIFSHLPAKPCPVHVNKTVDMGIAPPTI